MTGRKTVDDAVKGAASMILESSLSHLLDERCKERLQKVVTDPEKYGHYSLQSTFRSSDPIGTLNVEMRSYEDLETEVDEGGNEWRTVRIKVTFERGYMLHGSPSEVIRQLDEMRAVAVLGDQISKDLFSSPLHMLMRTRAEVVERDLKTGAELAMDSMFTDPGVQKLKIGQEKAFDSDPALSGGPWTRSTDSMGKKRRTFSMTTGGGKSVLKRVQ